MTTLYLRLAAVLFTAAGGWLTVSLSAAADMPVHRESTSQTTLRFEGRDTGTIDLRTVSGSIRVTAQDRSDVRLTVARRTDAERESDVEAADRDVRLITSSVGNTISAIVQDRETRCGDTTATHRDAWWDRPRYRVTVDLTAVVPTGTRLRLCTINGEAIVAVGPLGAFDVSNVNGRVELSGVRGAGRAATVNGSVSVAFAESPRDVSEFKTVNGDVTVTFPADLAADLRLKTFHGELLTDFDVQPLPVQPRPITAGAADGPRSPGSRRSDRVVYRSGGFTDVRAGDGGPVLTFETLNGDVRILRAR